MFWYCRFIRGKIYDGKETFGEASYWYNFITGGRTGQHEAEMWAHYFSFGICGDVEAIHAMEIYLPETMKQYDEIAEKMINRVGE